MAQRSQSLGHLDPDRLGTHHGQALSPVRERLSSYDLRKGIQRRHTESYRASSLALRGLGGAERTCQKTEARKLHDSWNQGQKSLRIAALLVKLTLSIATIPRPLTRDQMAMMHATNPFSESVLVDRSQLSVLKPETTRSLCAGTIVPEKLQREQGA